MRPVIFILLSIMISQGELLCQDSLCYSQIDRLATEYKREKFGFRINGEYPEKGNFREFYVTDSSKKILLAVHVSVTDKNNISESTGFYFNNGELILVENFRWNGQRKYDMEHHYYLKGKCSQPNYGEKKMIRKLFFLRVASMYKLNFENGKVQDS